MLEWCQIFYFGREDRHTHTLGDNDAAAASAAASAAVSLAALESLVIPFRGDLLYKT